MNLLQTLFIESLGLEYPFKLGKIKHQELDGKTSSVTFTIEIDKTIDQANFIRNILLMKRVGNI